MGAWILENSLLTALVVLAVFLLCRAFRRRPAFCHLLWVLAFVSLVMPPMPVPASPGTLLRSELSSWLQASTPAPSPAPATPSASRSLAPAESPGMPSVTLPVLPMRPGGGGGLLPSLSARQWVAGLWTLGALVLLGGATLRILAFHRHLRGAPGAPPELIATVRSVASRLGVEAPPIKLVEGAGSPAIWCFGRPQLLVPARDGRAVPRAVEPSLLAHELAHLARRDHWIARLELLATAACWWNPLFWVIRRQVRDYAELSCDAWALWAYPDRRHVFAGALIDAQERTRKSPMALQGLGATHSEFKSFERRLSMIMSKNVSRQVSRSAAAVALLTTALVLPGFSVQKQEHSKAKAGKQAVASRCIDELVEVKQLGDSGEKLFQSKRYDEAIDVFAKVLALDPENGMAHARMGYMLVAQGKYERAAKHFEMEVELGHNPATAIYNLACAAALSGDARRGLALLDQSVRRGFTNGELMASDPHLESLRHEQAFAQALEASKKSAALRSKLAALDGQKDLEDLVAIYRLLTGIATEDGALQDEGGLVLLRAKEYEAALQAFQRQVAVGHQVGRGHYNSACAHALSGRSEAALQALELAADHGMAYAEVLKDEDLASLRGAARFQAVAERLMAAKAFQEKLEQTVSSGDIESAAKSLEALATDGGATDKTRSWAAFELGRLQLKAEQPKASIASFQQAAAAGYPVEAAAFQIGTAYAMLGEVDDALRHFDKALLLGFAEPKALERGLELCGLLDTDQGRELLKRAHMQALKRKQKELEKKKAALELGGAVKRVKKPVAGVDATERP